MRTRARMVVVGSTLSIFIAVSSIAAASWSRSTSVQQTISSATIDPPGSVTVARDICLPGVSSSLKVSWTMSPSGITDGYEIYRGTTSPPATAIGTVSGRGTTTFMDTTASFATTYVYMVKATRGSWRSTASNEATVTTLSSLCA